MNPDALGDSLNTAPNRTIGAGGKYEDAYRFATLQRVKTQTTKYDTTSLVGAAFCGLLEEIKT